MVKITTFQAGLILKLNSIENFAKSPKFLAIAFEKDYKYTCEQLRMLKAKGFVKEVSVINNKKYYEPTEEGVALAKKTLWIENE